MNNDRSSAVFELITRIVATTAIWSIASVIGLRLRHPMISLTLGAVAAALTFLIWTYPVKKGE